MINASPQSGSADIMDRQSCESDGSVFSSSSDLTNNAVPTQGPLFELSATLMAALPIKRGLSKYFQGKSQSFASLSQATRIEDLAKKEAPALNNKKSIKAWKICGSGFTPGPCSRAIAKKSSGGCCASSVARRGRSSLLYGSKPPALPTTENP